MLSTPGCERLVRYYRLLKDGGERTVTSAELALALDVDSSLVRKDLAAVGLRGHPCKGFSSSAVCSRLVDFLGAQERWKAAIVGAGRLGSAIACHREFQGMGLEVAGVFDCDPEKVGQVTGGVRVLSMEVLESHIRYEGIQLAILAVPGDSAQGLADRVVRAGVCAIWNFSPNRLVVPPGVLVRHEQLVVGLGTVLCGLRQKRQAEARWNTGDGRPHSSMNAEA